MSYIIILIYVCVHICTCSCISFPKFEIKFHSLLMTRKKKWVSSAGRPWCSHLCTDTARCVQHMNWAQHHCIWVSNGCFFRDHADALHWTSQLFYNTHCRACFLSPTLGSTKAFKKLPKFISPYWPILWSAANDMSLRSTPECPSDLLMVVLNSSWSRASSQVTIGGIRLSSVVA